MLRIFKLSRWYVTKEDGPIYCLSGGALKVHGYVNSGGALKVHGYVNSSAVERYMKDNQGVFFPKEFFFCS